MLQVESVCGRQLKFLSYFSLSQMFLTELTNHILQQKAKFSVKKDVMTQYYALLAQGDSLMVVHKAHTIILSDETPL